MEAVLGERLHQAGGEHLTVALPQAFAHGSVAPAVMIPRDGEQRILGGSGRLPGEQSVEVLPFGRIADLGEVAGDDHAGRAGHRTLALHGLGHGPFLPGRARHLREHLQGLRDVRVELVRAERRDGLAVVHPHVRVRDEVERQIPGGFGDRCQAEQQDGQKKRWGVSHGVFSAASPTGSQTPGRAGSWISPCQRVTLAPCADARAQQRAASFDPATSVRPR